MSSEGILVTNPKGNNRDLEIRVLKNGSPKKIKTLRPGESAVFDRREISILERSRPPRLLWNQDGSFVQDRKRSCPSEF